MGFKPCPRSYLFCSFQISENIKDAIVYLDAGSSESFQFLGAFPLFLELGARAVCSLENVSPIDEVPCVTLFHTNEFLSLIKVWDTIMHDMVFKLGWHPWE